VAARLIAVDISEEELCHNADIDEKRIADITQGLPFEAEEIDLLTSCWVLEHLESVDDFVESTKMVLRRGGHCIHLFSSKFAPYALINQVLPEALAERVVYGFLPRRKGGRHGGRFPDFYNRCYYSASKKLMENNGFEVVDVHVSYYQSHYFSFFVPLYLLSVCYELLIQALGVKNLAARVLVIARKP
jgi:SAM-dependent methyltransferase